MNDDSYLTSAAAVPSDGDSGASNSALGAQETAVEDDPQTRIAKRILAQTKRKAEFVQDVIFNLDLLIYAELCVLYYTDCWFFAFIARAFVQAVFLSPKQYAIASGTKHRPFLVAILGSNAICLLAHLLLRRPEAGELTRGYLHGGVIIDFIGQKGPTSKFYLLTMDLLVTALQCFMMAVHVEQNRLRIAISATECSSTSLPAVPGNQTQDYDAEERGVHRDAVTTLEDYEMQNIRVGQRFNGPTNDDESGQILTESAREGLDVEGPLDLFYSGNAIIADFHVLHTIRSQWEDYGSATATAMDRSAGYNWVLVNRQLRRLDTLR